MIIDNKYNDNFHFKENYHQFVMVDYQDISDVKEKIKQHFFVNYIKCIFIYLVS